MENKIFAYARVSSKEQNLNRQLDELRKYVKNERDIFFDTESGKNFERTAYNSLKYQARKGDEIYIKSLDRFGRNKEQIKQELQDFRNSGVIIRILDIPTTLIDYKGQTFLFDMINNILIEVLGTFAEHERNAIHERQREGIAAARKRGVKLGRKTIKKPENWDYFYKKWKNKEIKAVEFMGKVELSKTTFYKLVKQHEEETAYILDEDGFACCQTLFVELK